MLPISLHISLDQNDMLLMTEAPIIQETGSDFPPPGIDIERIKAVLDETAIKKK